jgi:hypothetical protein
LDGFQKAEIGLKMEKISRQIALAKREAKAFTSETARDAANKRRNSGLTEGHGAIMPSASGDAHRIFYLLRIATEITVLYIDNVVTIIKNNNL